MELKRESEMAISEAAVDEVDEKINQPLMQEERNLRNEEEGEQISSKRHPWMVYFTTFVAVCGSFEFGSCVSTHFHL